MADTGCGFHWCVENGYDWVDLCHPWNESQRPVLLRCFTLSEDAASDQACCRQYVFTARAMLALQALY